MIDLLPEAADSENVSSRSRSMITSAVFFLPVTQNSRISARTLLLPALLGPTNTVTGVVTISSGGDAGSLSEFKPYRLE